jgi:hypothetical protein
VNQSNKDKEDRVKFLGYITPIITDYAENNQINPAVCYEVCHELELMMIEKCKARGINGRELEKHKQAAETSFEVSKESLKKDGGLLS